MRVAAAILCGGSGTRFGSDKLQATIRGRPVWRFSFDRFSAVCDDVFVVGPDELRNGVAGCVGGPSRTSSVRAAVDFAAGRCDALLVHDGARPLVEEASIRKVIAAVSASGAAALCTRVTDTVRDRFSGSVLDRDSLVAMQTPQGATIDNWLAAFKSADTDFTDDCALFQSAGIPVDLVDGPPSNIKITLPGDLERAKAILGAMQVRTGLGFDIHRFATDDRPLVLGGVTIAGHQGLEGHSDADVLLHAAADAVLGAACKGDIGSHFPPNDERWRGQASDYFLREACRLAIADGWSVQNIDIAVVAESPRIGPFVERMKAAIAQAAGIDPDSVNVKATTNERLGSLGRSEGIAAYATATLMRTE